MSKNNIETKLVANDENDINRFKQLSQAKNMIEPLSFYSGLKRKQVASLYSECKVGILINNDSQHAEKYTSPLKYFEYLSSGLQVDFFLKLFLKSLSLINSINLRKSSHYF